MFILCRLYIQPSCAISVTNDHAPSMQLISYTISINYFHTPSLISMIKRHLCKLLSCAICMYIQGSAASPPVYHFGIGYQLANSMLSGQLDSQYNLQVCPVSQTHSPRHPPGPCPSRLACGIACPRERTGSGHRSAHVRGTCAAGNVDTSSSIHQDKD